MARKDSVFINFESAGAKELSSELKQILSVLQGVTKEARNAGAEMTKAFQSFKNLPRGAELQQAREQLNAEKGKSTTKRIRGLANYRNIAKEAELVSTRTQIMADGTRRTVELFRQVGEEGTTTYEAINKKIVKVNEALNKNNEEQEEANKKQSTFSKLWSALKRITFYRTVRRAIQLVTQGIGQGLTNLREYDKELDTTLKSLSNAGTALKNSFASSVGSLLKTVEPLVTRIADGIANITNRINEAKAVMSGATTYTKILTSDTEEWKQQLEDVGKTLLSFDKFESLEKQQQYTGTIEAETGISPESANQVVNDLNIIKEAIKGIVLLIASIKFAELITNIGKTGSALQKLKTTGLDPVKFGVSAIIFGVGEIVSGILNAIKAFTQGGTALEKFASILKIVAGALGVVFGILMMTKVATSVKTIVGAIAGVATIGAVIATGIAQAKKAGQDIQGYATGGIPDKSEMFYMNEYGKPEALVNTGGTQTNVINIDQLTYGMKQGFVQAIYETGLLDAMQSTVVVEGRNIDNNAVARGLFNALKTESTRRGGNQL